MLEDHDALRVTVPGHCSTTLIDPSDEAVISNFYP